jgi:hypothetical protein
MIVWIHWREAVDKGIGTAASSVRTVPSLLCYSGASILVLCANCSQGGVPAFVDPQDVDSGIRDDDPGFQFMLSATGVGVERTGYCCCIGSLSITTNMPLCKP